MKQGQTQHVCIFGVCHCGVLNCISILLTESDDP